MCSSDLTATTEIYPLSLHDALPICNGHFVEVQGTAEGKPFTRQSIGDLLSLAEKGIRQLFQAQQDVLKGPK